MKIKIWTPEDDAQLRELWTRGLSFGQIATALGTTRGAAVGRASRLKLKRLVLQDTRFRTPLADVEQPEEMPSDPIALNPVTIVDLEGRHCRWPIGNPGRYRTMLYCGNDKDVTVSYCKCHAEIAYPRGIPVPRNLAPSL